MLKVGTRVADRFVVERLLGEGGMGFVFEALDEERGERVALKTLGLMGGEAIYRLKKEFRILADIAHPNLIRLHELFSDQDLWFFSMERVHGLPFDAYVRAGGSALFHTRLRQVMLALTEGVEAIHRAGKIHRDLKPSNVLVGRAGKVTILDFGLVETDREDASVTASQEGAGTPAYMAPEQMLPNGVCPESDWYAVGVMLFETLTGELPFRGTALQVIKAKAALQPAPDPRTLEPDAPEDLSTLARDLLAPLPEDRPTPAQIRSRLGGLRERSPRESARESSGAPASMRPLFIGRVAELARLEEATRARSGVIALRGLSGMGKTTLIERFLAEVKARTPEAIVLHGRCYERESLPFKAFDPIVDELSRSLTRMDAVDAALLTPRDTPELCRLFPVLARVHTLAKASSVRAPVNEPPEVRRRAFEALRELFARLGEMQPVIIAIDDLQWGDLDSGWLLSRLVAQPEAPKVLVLLGYRSDEEERSALLKHLVARTVRDFIDLEPLGEAESTELAAKLRPSAGSEAALAIARESGGSPFFIGALASDSDGANGESASLENVLTRRVADLEPSERALLEVVSVAGTPIARDRALRAAMLAPAQDAGIPVLRAASLLRTTTDESLVTYHDRIREAVVGGLDDERRRAIHHALTRVIDESDVDALALHHREAGDREEALRFTMSAADRATTALAAERAASLLRQALSLSPEDDVRRTLRTRLADALADAGHATQAADLYLELARENNDASLEARAASTLTAAGLPARGLDAVRRVTTRLDIWMPRSPNLAFVVGVLWLVYLHLFVVNRRERVKLDAKEFPRVEAMQVFAFVLSLMETPHALYFAARSSVLAFQADDEETRGLAIMNAAWSVALVRPSDPRVDGHLATLAKIPSTDFAALHAFISGVVHMLRGEWVEAHDALVLAETRPYRGRLRQGTPSAFARTWMPWTLFWTGRIRDLARVVPGTVADAKARGDVTCLLGTMQVAPVAWVALDDVATAEAETEEAFGSWHRAGGKTLGFSPVVIWEVTARTLLDLYRGGSDAARHHDAVWKAIERSGMLRSPLVGLNIRFPRAFGLIDRASKLPQAERGAILDAVLGHARHLERNPISTAAGVVAWSHAAVASLRGDDFEARRELARAAALYDAAHASAFAACARYWLGGAEREASLVFMAEQGIVSPERFARMLAPGFAEP